MVLWLARRVDKEEARELYRHNRRLQFFPNRMVLNFYVENPQRPTENLVKLLQKHGGKSAAAAVQKQLTAANAAETLASAR